MAVTVLAADVLSSENDRRNSGGAAGGRQSLGGNVWRCHLAEIGVRWRWSGRGELLVGEVRFVRLRSRFCSSCYGCCEYAALVEKFRVVTNFGGHHIGIWHLLVIFLFFPVTQMTIFFSIVAFLGHLLEML